MKWSENQQQQKNEIPILNWTLSQGVTAAVPPSNEGLYKLAVVLGPRVRKINPGETKELEKISKYLSPIFQA